MASKSERGIYLKKQRKDNAEEKNSKVQNEKENEVNSKDTENPAVKDEKPEKEPAENSSTEKKDEEKQPSETDVLKFYVKQTLEELKKQKEENEKLKSEFEVSEAQLRGYKDKLDSTVKEYDNYRRRTTVEKENLGAEATSKAVLALLPALDNLERAVPFADSNPESFKKGVEMTLRQLEDAFKSLGVEEIEAQGAEFNPEFHEAVMHVEDESLGESVITDVFQKGYKIGDKIVRHSVVKVAN